MNFVITKFFRIESIFRIHLHLSTTIHFSISYTMPKCAVCTKTYDYPFAFNLNQFHMKDQDATEYIHSKYDVPLCSKYCVSNFVERKCSESGHKNDTFVVDYKFPLTFCDKCGHGTHPTEFCEQIKESSDEMIDFHERHMAGQGCMVKLTGGLADVYLGKGWLLGARGVRYAAKCIQLQTDLKARIPLAVIWNNPEELAKFLPTIALDGTEHEEVKDILTELALSPSKEPKDISGEYKERHFYVFQVVQKVECTRKLFFPYQLAMENCWFPVEQPRITRFRRFFYGNLKSPIQFLPDHEWTDQEKESFQTMDEEDQDCFEDFLKGMKILENKQQVMEELNVNLKELESKLVQDVYIGEAPKKLDKGDNVLTQEDKKFLIQKGFEHQHLDDLFLEQMESLGISGSIECKEEYKEASPTCTLEECEACEC